MAGTNKKAADPGQATPTDHPLVPNAQLRLIHAAMLALRGSQAARKPSAPNSGARGAAGLRGMEAMLAASLLSLQAGDLLSLPAEMEPVNLQDRALGLAPGVQRVAALGYGADRILAAMGAVAAVRDSRRPPTGAGDASGGGRLLLVYALPGEVPGPHWARLLGIAQQAALPVLFAVLPAATGRARAPGKASAGGPDGSGRGTGSRGAALPRPGWLAARSQGWGVPGIPVDADDPVALLRVLGESVLRARSADGPTLLEAVAWAPAGTVGRRADPVRAVDRVLARRGQPVQGGSASPGSAGRRGRRRS